MTREQLDLILNREASKDKLDDLTPRELELVSLLSQGTGFRRTAEEMGADANEFKALKESAQKKLKLKDDIALLQYSAQMKR